MQEINILETIYARIGVLKQPVARVLLALSWTLLATVLLVQSSSQPVVGPPAPPGQPDLMREIGLTLGHVIVFSVLVVLWWWALKTVRPPTRALFVAVVFALIFGVMTELAQTALADRQASLFDVAVNASVTMFTAMLIHNRLARPRLDVLPLTAIPR